MGLAAQFAVESELALESHFDSRPSPKNSGDNNKPGSQSAGQVITHLKGWKVLETRHRIVMVGAGGGSSVNIHFSSSGLAAVANPPPAPPLASPPISIDLFLAQPSARKESPPECPVPITIDS